MINDILNKRFNLSGILVFADKIIDADTARYIKEVVRMTQVVANNGFPFEIKRVGHNPYSAMTEEILMEKLKRSRVSALQGNYKSADAVIADMRAKYGI